MPGPASVLTKAVSNSHDGHGCSPEMATIPSPSKVLVNKSLPMLAPGPWHPTHSSCSPTTSWCCHPILAAMGHPRVLVNGRTMMFTGSKTGCGLTVGVATVVCKEPCPT